MNDSERTNPPWYSVPCLTRKQEPFVILSELPPEKKKLVWAHIRENHPAVANLLRSEAFQQFRQKLEQHVGPVGVGVDLKEIGGSLYGVRRKIKTDN